MRLATVGMSIGEVSGMRDHARLLAEGLEHAGVASPLHWLVHGGGPARMLGSRVAGWAGGLPAQLQEDGAEGVLLHYASFAYSYRGVPLLLAPVLGALRRSRLPSLALIHELAYPWRRELRGAAWALSQRAALVPLIGSSAAVIVTTDFSARWLCSRRWLARRPLAVAPVFSNLPEPSPQVKPQPGRLGLFGYAYDGASSPVVLDALALLRSRGSGARLVLLGAPGADSEAGAQWAAQARARGVAELLSFSGRLPPQELSDELARCEALLCVALLGPTSRKGTLAASLASGRPVVALDGPRTWSELVSADALRVVAREPGALAGELSTLLADEALREQLGARGRGFHEQRMAVRHTVARVVELMGAAL